MKESKKIGLFLFLYTRDELSPAEHEELLVWRNQDPENEKLFFQMTDPDSLRKEMQDYYKERDEGFEKLKARLPFLSGTRLSGSLDTAKIFYEAQESEVGVQQDLSENVFAGSGLTPVEYWGSMISMLGDSEGTGSASTRQNKVVPISRNAKKLKLKRVPRLIRILMYAAACLGILVFINYLSTDKKHKNYEATMMSPDGIETISGVKSIFHDFIRGLNAGQAGIEFGETEKGEPLYIAANRRKAKKDKFYTLLTAPAGEFVLRLPEGTMIWLNAASSIKYPANFNQDTIHIEVEGEVYIQMSKDTTHHFLISPAFSRQEQDTAGKAGNGQRSTVNAQPPTINVNPSSNLNINTYSGDDEMLVTLIRGDADAKVNRTENKFRLMNGQQALIIHDSLAFIQAVDANEIIAWKNGEFYFKDAALQTLMPSIAKWYDVDIQYVSQIQDKKFSLRVPRNTPLKKVLESLQKQGLHITQQGKTITIWK